MAGWSTNRTTVAIVLAVALVVLGVVVVFVVRRAPPSDPGVASNGARKVPLDMPVSEAQAYLTRLGYPSAVFERNMLIARDLYCRSDDECRARLPRMMFHYGNDGERPRCITVMHPYPLDWRSIAGKLSGAEVSQLPPPSRGYLQIVPSGAGSIRIAVRADATHLSVGPDCEALER